MPELPEPTFKCKHKQLLNPSVLLPLLLLLQNARNVLVTSNSEAPAGFTAKLADLGKWIQQASLKAQRS